MRAAPGRSVDVRPSAVVVDVCTDRVTVTSRWIRHAERCHDPRMRLACLPHVCLPHAGGARSFYRRRARRLPRRVELSTVRNPGLQGRVSRRCLSRTDDVAPEMEAPRPRPSGIESVGRSDLGERVMPAIRTGVRRVGKYPPRPLRAAFPSHVFPDSHFSLTEHERQVAHAAIRTVRRLSRDTVPRDLDPVPAQ